MRITVVGGGTAGWITALLAHAVVPGADITLIESEEIGILGAGEGTTPHFVGLFLDVIGVPVSALVQHAGATIKNSIKFTNWRGDGEFYVHPFVDQITPTLELPFVHPRQPLPNHRLSFSCHLSEKGRVLMSPKGDGPAEPGSDPMLGLEQHGQWAVHFDARRLASFLKQVGLQRGIRRVEGIVEGVEPRADGGIGQLRLADGQAVGGDFFFDCTGMRRLLIGGHFGVPLVDVGNTLPVDRALPFSLPLDGPRPPYTEAIAMEAGWAWKIPVEGRYGCGYVYDSDFATDEEARQHVRRRFGDAVELPRVLSFRAGYMERIWEHNCVAVGLSSGFLEPLEATSIWASVITLHELFRVHLAVGDTWARADLNAFHRRLNERIVDFLYVHYLGARRDTPFWATFAERTTPPPTSASILERGAFRWPFEEDPLNGGHPTPFPAQSWLWVTKGLGLLDGPAMERSWEFFGLYGQHEQRIHEQVARIRRMGRSCLDHESALRVLRGG